MMELDRNKVAFITCVNDDDMYSECLLYLKSLHIPDGITVEYIPIYNAHSMCAGYNEGAQQTSAYYKIYLHQDVLIVNKNIIADLLAIFEDKTVGLVGMIGCRSLPRSGVWWDGLRTYGRVLHHCEPESVVDSHCMEPDGHILTWRRWMGFCLRRSTIFRGVMICSQAGIYTTPQCAWRCSGMIFVLSSPIRRRTFGVFIARVRSRLRRNTNDFRRYFCTNMERNCIQRFEQNKWKGGFRLCRISRRRQNMRQRKRSTG